MLKNVHHTMFVALLVFFSHFTFTVDSALIGTSVCNHLTINSADFLTRYPSFVNSPPLRRYLAETEEIVVTILREHARKWSGGNTSKTDQQECVTQATARFAHNYP